MPAPPTSPPDFISDQIGNAQDTVDIQLGSDDPVQAISWEIESSILSQPSRWTINLGGGGNGLTPQQQFWRYPPGTPFTLKVNGCKQATGSTDRRRLEGKRGASGTSLQLSGRDSLAPLWDGDVLASVDMSNRSPQQMVVAALTAVGLDPGQLVLDNTANRNAQAGCPITAAAPAPVSATQPQTIPGVIGGTAFAAQAKFGEKWLEFLRRYLDRAGLMLWAAGGGGFVLSSPNAALSPCYQLFRDLTHTLSNVLDFTLDDDCTNRHTEMVMRGRGGGKKSGRIKVIGDFVDQELLDYGFDKPAASREPGVQTAQQLAYFARRKLAEERRAGWHLTYVLPGHTLPVCGGSATLRAIIVPDTTIAVNDESSGICGTFYIEAVKRERQPQTQTTIRLMRPQDVLVLSQVEPATQGKVVPSQVPTPSGTPVNQGNYAAIGNALRTGSTS